MNAERERKREREREKLGARERLHVKETHTFLHKIWHRTYAKEAHNTTTHNNADYQSSLVPLLLREEEEHRSNENAIDDLASLVVSFLRVREDQLFFEITVNAPSSSPECNASTTPNDNHFFFFFFFPTAKHRRRAPRARFCPFGRSFAGV